MKIEIVEFYPQERDDEKQYLKGTLHIYLIEEEMDIRGVFVSKQKERWCFSLPSRFGIDPETQEKVRYPVICFTDRKKNKELIKLLKEKGKEYIESSYLNQPGDDPDGQKAKEVLDLQPPNEVESN